MPALRDTQQLLWSLITAPEGVGDGLRRLDMKSDELAHIVAMFNHLTRMADGFGLQLDAPTIAATEGDALPPLGG